MKRQIIFSLAAWVILGSSSIADPEKVQVLAECSYTEGDHSVKFQFTKREFDMLTVRPPSTTETRDSRLSGVMFSILRTAREGEEPVNLGGIRYPGGERMAHTFHQGQLATDGKRVWALLTTPFNGMFHLIDVPCDASGAAIPDYRVNESIGTPVERRNNNPLNSRIIKLPDFLPHYMGIQRCKMTLVDGKVIFTGRLTFMGNRPPDGSTEEHPMIFSYDPKTEKWTEPKVDQTKKEPAPIPK
jgi:hypothetical protein